MRTILIGACSDLGVHKDGAKEGPIKLLCDYPNKMMLYQDEDYIKSTAATDLRKNELEINKFNTALYDIVDSQIKNGLLPITVGGDHSVAIASALASSNNRRIGIIWIDAHTDYNTFQTTLTGNIHGLPLATITGCENVELRPFNESNTINPKNTVIIGARSIDELEYKNMSDMGIKYYTTEDIETLGVGMIINEAFDTALKDVDGVHISCDLDVVDPTYAPGVSIPERDGITDDTLLEMTDEILKRKDKIYSYDIVELNPRLDIDDRTLNLAKKILNKVKKKMEK